MSIKPIDLQTNIGQMHEVGKGEQARSGAIAEQQHIREKESQEKSQLVNSKLDESKKAERTAIREEEEKRRERRMNQQRENRRKDKDNEKINKNDLPRDEKIGNIIDVKK